MTEDDARETMRLPRLKPMPSYRVMQRLDGAATVYGVHDSDLRCVSVADLSHDDAVVLCERLNSEIRHA